jgi:hypothetical protein
MDSKMKQRSRWLVFALLLTTLVVACSYPRVKLLRQPQADTETLKVLVDPKKLTQGTRDYLGKLDLLTAYQRDPASVIDELHRQSLAHGSPLSMRLSLLELCMDQAGLQEGNNADAAVGLYLAAAQLSFAEGLASSAVSDINAEVIAAYNHSAGRIALLLHDGEFSRSPAVSFEGPWQTYQLTSHTAGEGLIDPAQFDELHMAEYLKLKHFDIERIARPGLGAVIIAYLLADPERLKQDPFMSPLGMAEPINVTLQFSGDDGQVSIAYHDLRVVDEAVLGERSVPLATDLTTPLVFPFNYVEERNIAWKRMVRPERYLDLMRLFRFQPYRPDKIPVIFVHGLLSSEKVWLSSFNALNADPEVRKHYQLYVFAYPTGFPIGYNAAALRYRLQQFQQYYDPELGNPNMRKLVLIGHSMGGVLSDMQIRSSTDTLQKTFFKVPIAELAGVDDEQKTALQELLVFEASPLVTRAVFVAAPHRGSEDASGVRGTIGSALIKDPTEVVLTKPIPQIEGLTAEGHMIASHPLNGIESLVPHSPALLAILDLPVRDGVQYHSIIGQKDARQPLQQSTDGTVPYWSSHLDDATSEAVVFDKHTPLAKNPGAVEELRRILYLHAELPYQPPPG